jgi:chromosome segregation ATPase
MTQTLSKVDGISFDRGSISPDEGRRLLREHIIQLRSKLSIAQAKLLSEKDTRIALQARLKKEAHARSKLSEQLVSTRNALLPLQERLLEFEAARASEKTDRTAAEALLKRTIEKLQSEIKIKTSQSLELKELLDRTRHSLAEKSEAFDEINRKMAELLEVRLGLETRLVQVETELGDRNCQVDNLEQSRSLLTERNDHLMKELNACQEAAHRAKADSKTQQELISLLEGQFHEARDGANSQTAGLKAQVAQLIGQLRCEQFGRAQSDKALIELRNEIARLLPELCAQRFQLESRISSS